MNADLSNTEIYQLHSKATTPLDLTHANFRGADLTNSRWKNVDASFADLRGATLKDIKWTNVKLKGATLGWRNWLHLLFQY